MSTKKTLITIAGKPGSGKSTTARNVATLLQYERFSSGDLFREIAMERGVNINEINTIAEQERNIDIAVDQRLREIGVTGSELVIDSRMAWHWIPQSFKVYLDLELHIAAERIIQGMDEKRRAIEHIPDSADAYTALLADRLASEVLRYEKLYQINPYDTSHYDLVVDTALYNPDQAAQLIIDTYHTWLEN